MAKRRLFKIKDMFRLDNYNFSLLRISLIFLVVVASILGIIVIGSAEKSVQSSQIMGLVLGLLVMAFFTLLDYKWLIKFYWILYAVSLVLLLAVVLFGSSSGGAERWLYIGPLRFQPSELVKIFLIIFFSVYFSENKLRISDSKFILRSIALIGLPLFLIVKQPDLSTTVVIGMVWCIMIYISGISTKITVVTLLIVFVFVSISLFLITRPNIHILKGYQEKRILAWLDPEKYADSEAMQQQNSMMAIGSGKLSGKGLNNNKVASMKNGNFVPEPQTDFIFAVIGEELGFVGTTSVIILLLMIVLACIDIGRKCFDFTGKLICIGFGSLVGLQSMVNIAVATGLLPNTGVTLPFISYGVTSLVSLYIGIGIVLNVGLQPGKYR